MLIVLKKKATGYYSFNSDGVEVYTNIGSVVVSCGDDVRSFQFCVAPKECKAGPFWAVDFTVTDRHGRITEYDVAAVQTETQAHDLCTLLSLALTREGAIDVDLAIAPGTEITPGAKQ